jgi:hypothetical protein
MPLEEEGEGEGEGEGEKGTTGASKFPRTRTSSLTPRGEMHLRVGCLLSKKKQRSLNFPEMIAAAGYVPNWNASLPCPAAYLLASFLHLRLDLHSKPGTGMPFCEGVRCAVALAFVWWLESAVWVCGQRGLPLAT